MTSGSAREKSKILILDDVNDFLPVSFYLDTLPISCVMVFLWYPFFNPAGGGMNTRLSDLTSWALAGGMNTRLSDLTSWALANPLD